MPIVATMSKKAIRFLGLLTSISKQSKIPSICPRCGNKMVPASPLVARVENDLVIRGMSIKSEPHSNEVCMTCNYNCR